MDKTTKHLGITLIFIGVILLIQKFFNINSLNGILWLILGITLLFLYKNKGEKWAMPLGVIVTYIGVSKILSQFNIFLGISTFFTAFPFILSFILILLYFEKRYLALFNIGIIFLGIAISSLKFISLEWGSIFLSFNITLMIGLFIGYILSGKKSKFNLYISIIYAFFVLKDLVFDGKNILSLSVFLIFFGIILILKNKNNKDEIIDTTNNEQNNNFDNLT